MSWALVTGSAKGLGRALALRLAHAGHPLLIHYRQSGDEAAALQREIESDGGIAQTIAADFATREGIDDFLERLAMRELAIKYLVNNVGLYIRKSLLQTTDSEWFALFNANLHLPFLLTKALLPSIVREKGAILNIGVAGLQTRGSTSYDSAYTITKEALFYMTKMAAKELAASAIPVNMLSPGYLPNSVVMPTGLPNGEPNGAPTGIVDFDEVAEMMLYLFSPAGRSITGQNIELARGVAL